MTLSTEKNIYIIIDHMTFQIIDHGLVDQWIQTIFSELMKDDLPSDLPSDSLKFYSC